MLIILLNIFYFYRYVHNEGETLEGGDMDQSKAKKENYLKTQVNPCPRSHQERKRRQKISVLKKHLNY